MVLAPAELNLSATYLSSGAVKLKCSNGFTPLANVPSATFTFITNNDAVMQGNGSNLIVFVTPENESIVTCSFGGERSEQLYLFGKSSSSTV